MTGVQTCALPISIKVGPEFLNREGHAHGIAFADGTLTGGADPRGDGMALGF